MAIEGNVRADMQTKCSPRGVEAAIAALAARQFGVVSRRQLVGLGLGPGAIKHRVALGRLQPVHRSVYAVGHRSLKRDGWWLAAVLAAGPDAALSHRAAAALWRIRDSARAAIEVTAPRRIRDRDGLETHRAVLPADEITHEPGIPVTTPARTLFDLAGVVSHDQLEHAFNEAEYRRLTSPTSLDVLLARYPGRRGTANLRRVLEKHDAIGVTPLRSVLEQRFVTFLDANGLPRPLVNRRTEHGELDASWPEQRLIVEVDGWAAHGSRKAFEADRARDRALQTAGWRVVRITSRQLENDAGTIAHQLRTLLGVPPASPGTPSRRSARRARRPPRPTPATRSAAP